MSSYKKIPELKNYLAEYKKLKREVARKRTKINSLFEKYSFVEEIVSTNIGDFELEDSIRKLFLDLNFSATKPDTKRDVDVHAKYKRIEFRIEVKNSLNVPENEMFQAIKYTNRETNIADILRPIIIWNNAKSNQEYDDYRITDAKRNNYGILTTKELLKGYLKVKNSDINVDQFVELLQQPGLIKYSNSMIKKVKSGDDSV